MEDVEYERHSYYEEKNLPQDFLHFKLIVKTEEEKQEFLKASEYIHDFAIWGYENYPSFFDRLKKPVPYCLDSDIMAINWLMHLYETPEAIEVKPDEKFYGFELENKD